MGKNQNPQNPSSEEESPYVIELIDDDTGETVPFEHLDTVRIKEDDYIVCIPYDDEETEVTEVVMFKIDKDENSEDCLSQVVDEDLAEEIYGEFKKRNADKFDFAD